MLCLRAHCCASGLRLTGLRGDEKPTLLDTPIGRRQRVIAIALRPRRHGVWSRLGQGGLGVAQRRGNAGHPFDLRLGEVLEVLVALEGTIGHQVRGPVGRL